MLFYFRMIMYFLCEPNLKKIITECQSCPFLYGQKTYWTYSRILLFIIVTHDNHVTLEGYCLFFFFFPLSFLRNFLLLGLICLSIGEMIMLLINWAIKRRKSRHFFGQCILDIQLNEYRTLPPWTIVAFLDRKSHVSWLVPNLVSYHQTRDS